MGDLRIALHDDGSVYIDKLRSGVVALSAEEAQQLAALLISRIDTGRRSNATG